MSRLELDDQILNHPKFIRAVKIGGSDTIHMWLGIRAYVGQNLSNGFVPADMVDEVRGPIGKKRTAALKALMDVGLLHHVACGRISPPACEACAARVTEIVPIGGAGILMHDYLFWSRSKSQVLADRERSRDRQAKSREKSRRDSHGDEPKTSPYVAPASASASASATPPTTTTTTPKPPVVVGKIRCPGDLELTEAQRGQLMLVPDWAVAEITRRFRAQWVDSTDGDRTMDQWHRSLSSTISATWNDPGKRPKEPKQEPKAANGEEPRWL